METQDRLNVLFLPAWYPHREDPMLGLFVKRHALAVSKFANISVLSVILCDDLEKVYEVETSVQENITEILIYTKKYQSNFKWVNKLVNGIRYVNSYLAGWRVLELTNNLPDLNHVHILTRAGIMALYFKIRYNIPFIITEHWSRYLPHHANYSGGLRKALTKRVLNASLGISTVSEALKKGMNDVGLYHYNWQIIPNVVDTKTFQPSDKQKKLPIKFSHISCFEEQSKNMSGIISAFEKLVKRGIDIELIMIGDGPDYESTKELVSTLKLDNHIQFTGVLEKAELIDKMTQCHASILFSHYETFAIVIPENLACGIPVIATNTGGIPEVLPTKFGVLVPPKDEEALTEAIDYMVHHYQEYNTDDMIEYVEDNYSYDGVGHQFFVMYQKALEISYK